MLFGYFILVVTYIISILLLYTILFGHYNRNGEKQKHPLWEIISLLIALLIPGFNLLVCVLYMWGSISGENDHFESFMTKKY